MEVVVRVEMEVPPLRIEAFNKEMNNEGILNSLEEHREAACLLVS